MNSLGIIANKEKLGNLMVYLSEKIRPLHQTKLIKLLYFIDEYAVLDNGIPITWLEYKVWEKGPVAPETYYLKNNPEDHSFSDYITLKKRDENSIEVKPARSFDNSLFSDYELEIIHKVVSELGNKRAQDLIDLSHQEGSLWDVVSKRNNVDFAKCKTTTLPLDLSELISDDPVKFFNYQEARDMMLFSVSTSGK
jgi:uncharacterized phage-associated protein